MVKKALYKATCLSELSKLVPPPENLGSIELAQIRMAKCFRRALELKDNDEEVAYLLLRRYFDFYELMKHRLVATHSLGVFPLSLKKQSAVAMDYLEKLHASLKIRYDELNVQENERLRLPSPPREEIDEIRVTPSDSKSPNNEWISVEELAFLLRNKRKVLICDIRPTLEFSACHLKWDRLIHFPFDELFHDGLTFTGISSILSKGPYKDLWSDRGQNELVVLLDSASGKDRMGEQLTVVLPRSHPLLVIKNAIYKWDAQHVINVEPRILAGGMVKFVLMYAPLTTNADYRMRVHDPTAEKSSDLPDADQIVYPKPLFPDTASLDSEPHTDDNSLTRYPETNKDAVQPTTDRPHHIANLQEHISRLRLTKPGMKANRSIASLNQTVTPQIDRVSKPSKVPLDTRSKDGITGGPSDHSSETSDAFPTHRKCHSLDMPTDEFHSTSPPVANGGEVYPMDVNHKKKEQLASTDLPTITPAELTVLPLENILSSVTNANESTLPLPSCHLRPIGLQNLGNTCYMNAALQSLLHTRALVTFFLRGLDTCFTNSENPLGYGGALSTQFQRLFTGMWSKSNCLDELRGLKTLVTNSLPTFAGTEQQDSLEFLIFLLDGLHEDMNEGSSAASTANTSDVDARKVDRLQHASIAWNEYLRRNKSIIVSTFQGQLLSTVCCQVCSRESATFDTFMYLSVPISTQSPCDLQNHYGSMEAGHYTAFCRGVSDDQWYEYNDSTVTSIPESALVSSAAYILFYERLPRLKVFTC
ncbi:unnamed protein product [Dicrocoelium dendriticum]|nr:unnamed protein product [Dicrocoelium dendriticum]